MRSNSFKSPAKDLPPNVALSALSPEIWAVTSLEKKPCEFRKRRLTNALSISNRIEILSKSYMEKC